MEIKSDERIMEEITAEYNKNPEDNWRVSAFRDEKGRYDLYVLKGRKFWQIKTEFITPLKYIGVGGKATAKEQDTDHSFGLRPLPKEYVKKIAKEARKGRISDELFREIMKIPPVPTTDLPETQVLQGPVSLSPLEEISPSQRILDKKLAEELDRLVFREQGGSFYR